MLQSQGTTSYKESSFNSVLCWKSVSLELQGWADSEINFDD